MSQWGLTGYRRIECGHEKYVHVYP
jgi:hypothetical protein